MPTRSRGEYCWYSLAIIAALCLGSLTYGYAFSIISTTLGQSGFYKFFHLAASANEPDYAYTNRILGATSGLFSAGAFMGCWTMGWMCDALGRKKSLWIATAIAIVGSSLQAGAAAVPMFLVARWLTGYGVGNIVCLIPIIQAEISPPASRGFVVSQHGVILVLGYCIAGWVGYGSYFSSNVAFQWRFPLALGCLWPLLLAATIPWIPESPRWLIFQNRREEAYEILTKLHRRGVDSDENFVRGEFSQISQQVEVDKAAHLSESVWDLFRKPSYRKRMWCGFFTFFANESTVFWCPDYSVLIYQGLGESGSSPLLLSGIYVTIGAIGNYVNAILIDRVGRKPLFLAGLGGTLVALICEAACWARYAGTDQHAGLSAALFFIFLHLTFYGCCIDANSFVYASEISPTHIRSQGVAWSVGTLFLTTIPYLQAAPTVLATIQWKYFLVFIANTAVNIPIIYFTFPETKGLSLEDVGRVFGDDFVVPIGSI